MNWVSALVGSKILPSYPTPAKGAEASFFFDRLRFGEITSKEKLDIFFKSALF